MGRYASDPRERAQQLVAEGRLGGAKYGRMGGRPRTPRASEIAAGKRQKHAEEIVPAFRMHCTRRSRSRCGSRPLSSRLKIEQQGVAQEIRAMDDFSMATEEELVNFILGYLTSARLVTSLDMQLREQGGSPTPDAIEAT